MPCDCKSLTRAGLFYAVQAIQTLGVVVVHCPSIHIEVQVVTDLQTCCNKVVVKPISGCVRTCIYRPSARHHGALAWLRNIYLESSILYNYFLL